MESLVHPRPLGPLARDLSSGKRDLIGYIEESLALVEAADSRVEALLPEEGRRERLLSEARGLLARYPDADARPPLFGILLGVKDLFNADGFETRAGSRLPPALFAGKEAAVVTVLKAAGALVIGKTVTTEFAYFAPGPTRNPRRLGHTPGGSSSGSAAAVAAGFCPLALGTQTIGSISRPAAFCGVVGFKPSYGRVPRDGVVDFAPSVDHVGFFTQDMRGMGMAARICLAGWRGDARPRLPTIAIPDGPYLEQASDGACGSFESALDRLAGFGCAIVRVPAFGDIAAINARHRVIAAAELARVHRRWYADYGGLYADKTRELIEKGLAIGDAELADARAGRAKLRSELEAALRGASADLWLSPAAVGTAPEGLESTGDPVMNLPWTHAGLPTLVLPDEDGVDGLPYGLQFAAPFGSDEELLAFGEFLEPVMRSSRRLP